MNRQERAELNRILPGTRWQPLRNGDVQAYCGKVLLQVERMPFGEGICASLWCQEPDSIGHWRQVAKWQRQTVAEAVEGLRVQLQIHIAAVQSLAGLEP